MWNRCRNGVKIIGIVDRLERAFVLGKRLLACQAIRLHIQTCMVQTFPRKVDAAIGKSIIIQVEILVRMILSGLTILFQLFILLFSYFYSTDIVRRTISLRIAMLNYASPMRASMIFRGEAIIINLFPIRNSKPHMPSRRSRIRVILVAHQLGAWRCHINAQCVRHDSPRYFP
ncbi:hypothetical protein Cv017_19780 [Chromobacterium subtsugae]|nr:hypothetical protein Cv017_19780 [Chromobacterium subtsugae]